MLLDTSVWIEYFTGSSIGEKVEAFIQKNPVFTCPLTIAEISVWCHKNGESPSTYLDQIKNISTVLELDEKILTISGRIYFGIRELNQKISLIDCIIYTTSQIHGLRLLTKDEDFRGLPEVEILSE